MWMASILLLAVYIDLLWGEPPAVVHPVVWMGHYLEFWGKWTTRLPPVGAFLAGAAAWCVGALAVAAVALCQRPPRLYPPLLTPEHASTRE